MSVVLFWDIDGTLLTTERAGILSFEDVFEQMTGTRVELTEAPTAGMTDYVIVERILREAGHANDEATVDTFLRLHGEQLADYLGRRQGHVMPGVREVLEDLEGRDDVREPPAHRQHRGGRAGEARALRTSRDSFRTAARSASARVTESTSRGARSSSPTAPTNLYVIGDTPADIECGKAIGARTIAVATGSYSVRCTRGGTSRGRVLERLPEPAPLRGVVMGLEPA